MTTMLPSTGTIPQPSRVRCDTADMKLAHAMMRRLYREAPRLVREVRDEQPRRQRAVARHVRMIVDLLHSHHQTEDTMLWDTLEQRTPACAIHVGLMRRQHGDMAHLLDALRVELKAWNTWGGADNGSVAGLLESISSTLEIHLGAEEELILPVASVTMSQREWDLLGAASRAHSPKRSLLVLLGYLMESVPPADRDAWMRANLPLPVRVVWSTLGAWQFALYRSGLIADA